MNIAEILKYCPKETKLYSPLFGEVTLFEVTEDKIKVYSIIKSALYRFNYDGTFGTEYTSVECMLFPSKDQRDWSKFKLPIKNGDIMMMVDGSCPFIASGEVYDSVPEYYCGIEGDGRLKVYQTRWYNNFYIPASEEAKKKLFDKMAEAGYRWNANTLELEKIEPKFKEGDVVVDEQGNLCLISKTENSIIVLADLRTNGTFNVYDTITYRLTKNITLATEEERNRFYSTLVREGYKYNKWQHKLIKQEFKPFDKVLVRGNDIEFWKADIYLGYIKNNSCPYRCTKANYGRCIPYEGNEYLLDTANSPT